jgi:glycine/D-amino acid oxidase-like deaminating enzyme
MHGTLVVGGGIAGLTIAWEPARRGADVTLLEQRSRGW